MDTRLEQIQDTNDWLAKYKKFADEHYDGDLLLAIEYMFERKRSDDIEEFTKHFSILVKSISVMNELVIDSMITKKPSASKLLNEWSENEINIS